jgi:hypothetical protein
VHLKSPQIAMKLHEKRPQPFTPAPVARIPPRHINGTKEVSILPTPPFKPRPSSAPLAAGFIHRNSVGRRNTKVRREVVAGNQDLILLPCLCFFRSHLLNILIVCFLSRMSTTTSSQRRDTAAVRHRLNEFRQRSITSSSAWREERRMILFLLRVHPHHRQHLWLSLPSPWSASRLSFSQVRPVSCTCFSISLLICLKQHATVRISVNIFQFRHPNMSLAV